MKIISKSGEGEEKNEKSASTSKTKQKKRSEMKHQSKAKKPAAWKRNIKISGNNRKKNGGEISAASEIWQKMTSKHRQWKIPPLRRSGQEEIIKHQSSINGNGANEMKQQSEENNRRSGNQQRQIWRYRSALAKIWRRRRNQASAWARRNQSATKQTQIWRVNAAMAKIINAISKQRQRNGAAKNQRSTSRA